jgi:hypothetical protein
VAIIDMAALKAYLGITDTQDDTRLTQAAAAASASVEDYCGRTFDPPGVNATARRFRASWPAYVDVNDFEDTASLIVAVDTGDTGIYTAWVLDTDFILEPFDGLLDGSPWPYTRLVATAGRYFPTWSRRPSVQVTAKWGWAAIPDPVTQAALIKGARIFRRKDSPEGVIAGYGDFGAIRITTKEDPDAVYLLASYQVFNAAILIR